MSWDTVASRSFDMMAEKVKEAAELLIKSHFGEQCKQGEYGCEVCRRYSLLESLIESPYKKKDE